MIIFLQCLQRNALFLCIELLLMLHNLLRSKGETYNLGRIADNYGIRGYIASHHTSAAYIAASAQMSATEQCHI